MIFNLIKKYLNGGFMFKNAVIVLVCVFVFGCGDANSELPTRCEAYGWASVFNTKYLL